MSLLADIEQEISILKETSSYRSLPVIGHNDKYIIQGNEKMLNLASNDYLGLASDPDLHRQFMEETPSGNWQLSSSSSRLLTGNHAQHRELEVLLARIYNAESALVFNSGYHANIGILPAICNHNTLILADKLVHASIIDGIRLSNAKSIRYRHNNYEQLESLVGRYTAVYDRIVIVTESLFSMDGDIADLPRLVELKKNHRNVLLYVDEAHAVGAIGETGLGYAELFGCIADIDFLVGTFGKSFASMGAFVVCAQIIKEYLINRSRPFIFSTALPPVCMQWISFVVKHLPEFSQRREHLKNISSQVQTAIESRFGQNPSSSHIVPIVVGDNVETVRISTQLQNKGFYLLPIRPPSVPEGSSRIRISLTANLKQEDIDKFVSIVNRL